MQNTTSTKGLKMVGKGAFTKCYLLDEKTCVLRSSDPVKECMSMGFFPESALFPTVERIDNELYKMAYYGKNAGLKKNLDADQWALYNDLRDVFHSVELKHSNKNRAYDWIAAFNNSTLDSEIKSVMIAAIEAVMNFGSDVAFEISPRNVRACNGKLILLDCFFLITQLKWFKG